jgi:hypothetical protein
MGDDADALGPIEAIILDRLVTRLRVEAWWSEHGDEAAAPVAGMVAVAGLPRTGTTALHYLLALDPRFRYLRKWELADPVPPPVLGREASDPRRPNDVPTANVRHIATADGPTEDGPIFSLNFSSAETIFPVPSYTQWWRENDHASSFPYHDRILRLLHSHRPPRHWLLKYPNFAFHLPQLVAQYPGARIVVTHRDPALALPSTCSVVLDSRTQRLPRWDTDKTALGRELLRQFAAGAQRMIDARAELGEERFIDVGQRELEADPMGTAARVYDFLGLALDDAHREAIAAWADSNRQGARGEHRYGAEEFGLTETEIRETFALYTARFASYCAP